MRRALFACGAAALLGVAVAQQPPAPSADPVTQALDTTVQTNRAAAQSQGRIDQLDEQTRALLERYRAALWQTQQLSVYSEQLEGLLASQDAERASLERQIAEMDRVEADLLPLLLRMVEALDQFVQLDLPFLKDERRDRVASLKRMMTDPEAGVAEKYRRILEAFQIEVDYGRSLGAERVEADGLLVDVLRVGRVALYSLSLDGQEGRWWDAANKKWEPLERRHVASLRHGLKIARELAAADVLTLPVPTPVAEGAGK